MNIYDDQQSLTEFSFVLNLVRHIVDCYSRQLYVQAEKGDKVITIPNPYTFVRALDAVICSNDVVTSRGKYLVSLLEEDGKAVTIFPCDHTWLTWKGIYIIDVFPVDGEFGISYPHGVVKFTSRFVGTQGIYDETWDTEVRMRADQQVDKMSLVLERFVQKVSS